MFGPDRPQFRTVVEALCAAFGVEPSEPLLEAYWMALCGLNISDIEAAAARALRESEHMPRPRALIAFIDGLGAEDRAVLAWRSVRQAIGAHGAYASVDFDDPVVNATIRNMGGWERFCHAKVEEFDVWLRKDFERIYCSLVRAGVSCEACAHLPGIHEAQNRALGGQTTVVPVKTGLPPHKRSVVLELATGVSKMLSLDKPPDGSAR